MKIRNIAFVFALPLLFSAAEPPKLSAVDQQATALESQLNKSLDTSPAAAKVMLGEWHIRFVNNGNAYVLNLKKNGSSHLARKGKAWDGVWVVKEGKLTITNPHDVIRIRIDPENGVYSGKNNWGDARLSRNELPKF